MVGRRRAAAHDHGAVERAQLHRDLQLDARCRPGWSAPGASTRAAGRPRPTRRAAATTARCPAPARPGTPAGKYGGALSFDGGSGNVTIPTQLPAQPQLELHARGLGQADRAERLPDDPDEGADRRLWLLAADRGHQDQQRLQQRRAASSTSAAARRSRSTSGRIWPPSSTTPPTPTRSTSTARRSRPRARPLPRCPTPRPWCSASRVAAAAAFERWHGLIDDIRVYNRPLSRRRDPGGHEHRSLGRHFFGTCARPHRR